MSVAGAPSSSPTSTSRSWKWTSVELGASLGPPMEQLRVVRYVPRSNILSPSRQDRTAFPPLPLPTPFSLLWKQADPVDREAVIALLDCSAAIAPLSRLFFAARAGILSLRFALARKRGFCSIGKKGDRTKRSVKLIDPVPSRILDVGLHSSCFQLP